MEHNYRYVIDKIYRNIKDLDGSAAIRHDLDALDDNRYYSEGRLASALEAVAKFYPDAYACVPEAASFVVHVRTKEEERKKLAQTELDAIAAKAKAEADAAAERARIANDIAVAEEAERQDDIKRKRDELAEAERLKESAEKALAEAEDALQKAKELDAEREKLKAADVEFVEIVKDKANDNPVDAGSIN